MCCKVNMTQKKKRIKVVPKEIIIGFKEEAKAFSKITHTVLIEFYKIGMIEYPLTERNRVELVFYNASYCRKDFIRLQMQKFSKRDKESLSENSDLDKIDRYMLACFVNKRKTLRRIKANCIASYIKKNEESNVERNTFQDPHPIKNGIVYKNIPVEEPVKWVVEHYKIRGVILEQKEETGYKTGRKTANGKPEIYKGMRGINFKRVEEIDKKTGEGTVSYPFVRANYYFPKVKEKGNKAYYDLLERAKIMQKKAFNDRVKVLREGAKPVVERVLTRLLDFETSSNVEICRFLRDKITKEFCTRILVGDEVMTPKEEAKYAPLYKLGLLKPGDMEKKGEDYFEYIAKETARAIKDRYGIKVGEKQFDYSEVIIKAQKYVNFLHQEDEGVPVSEVFQKIHDLQAYRAMSDDDKSWHNHKASLAERDKAELEKKKPGYQPPEEEKGEVTIQKLMKSADKRNYDHDKVFETYLDEFEERLPEECFVNIIDELINLCKLNRDTVIPRAEEELAKKAADLFHDYWKTEDEVEQVQIDNELFEIFQKHPLVAEMTAKEAGKGFNMDKMKEFVIGVEQYPAAKGLNVLVAAFRAVFELGKNEEETPEPEIVDDRSEEEKKVDKFIVLLQEYDTSKELDGSAQESLNEIVQANVEKRAKNLVNGFKYLQKHSPAKYEVVFDKDFYKELLKQAKDILCLKRIKEFNLRAVKELRIEERKEYLKAWDDTKRHSPMYFDAITHDVNAQMLDKYTTSI